MKEALIINVLILLLIGLIIAITSNPLAILCVLLLRDMPYGLIAPDEDGDEKGEEVVTDYEKRGIGFHTD